MNRGFSLRRHRSQPLVDQKASNVPTIPEGYEMTTHSRPELNRGLSKRLLRRFHSRSHSNHQHLGSQEKPDFATGLERSVSRREKIVHVIANPDTLFKHDDSKPKESHFNPDPKSVILRTFFSPRVDFGPSISPLYATQENSRPSTYTQLDPDTHIFDATLLPSSVIADLPAGYSMRPLTRGDFDRGFLEVLRVAGKVGYVSSARWDERCELLRRKASDRDEYILVIVEDKKDRVVGAGRWVADRGFMNNMAMNGRIEDIAVAREQKGKKFGLRLLEALVHISIETGCQKTVVNCSEANEAFHGQVGFCTDGTVMVLPHTTNINGRRGENIAHIS